MLKCIQVYTCSILTKKIFAGTNQIEWQKFDKKITQFVANYWPKMVGFQQDVLADTTLNATRTQLKKNELEC